MVLRKIVLFRALQLGDLMCAVPAIRAVKAAFPAAELVLLGMPWARNFVERFSRYFSGFIHFPGFPGLPEQDFDLDRFIGFLKEINRMKPDLLIQMHGNGTVINPLMEMTGARFLAGYFRPGEYCPDAKRFMPYPDDIPEIRRHLKLTGFLDIPPQGEFLEFPLSAAEKETGRQLFGENALVPGNYVCIHPGARDARRRWPPEHFAAVADELCREGYIPVFTGTASERELVAAVTALVRCPAVDLSGRTDLGSLGALLEEAALLVTNDTGVSHIAAALKTPSVVIFLASDPRRWAPLDGTLHRPVLPGEAGDSRVVLNHAREILAVKKERIGYE